MWVRWVLVTASASEERKNGLREVSEVKMREMLEREKEEETKEVK